MHNLGILGVRGVFNRINGIFREEVRFIYETTTSFIYLYTFLTKAQLIWLVLCFSISHSKRLL